MKCTCGHDWRLHSDRYGYCLKLKIGRNGKFIPCRCIQFTEKPKKGRGK